MPSYIELDKSPILPSATAEGKVILGVTTQGNLTITNNSGSVSSVGGVTEITREEIEILISSGSLTPGTHYKITNATTSSSETCLQEGGVTIILQAVTTSSLSPNGIGLFWNPKYEDPDNPTLPPDTNYLVWSNTAHLNIQNLSGHFEYNEYTYFYSSNTDNSTYAYIQGLPSNSGVTIAFENQDSAAFFANPDNFVGLTMQGDWSGETADVTGNEYVSSYPIGCKVIWGGKVWQNLSGSVGYAYGMGDVNSAMNLNPEDWTIVPYNDTDYTLVANEIEYEFERDNISYRNDGTNRVRSNWQETIYWGWGWNTIKYFPWGNYYVKNNSFENVYLTNFVNYPHDAYAGELNFKTYSTLNAYAWGRYMSLYNISAEEGADVYENTFAYGIEINNIILAQDAQMYNIITAPNAYIEYVNVGMNARFGHLRMYNGSSIRRVDIGTDSRLTNMYMYNNTHIFDVTLGINSDLRCMYLDDYSEIKYVSIGNYSRIEYNNLYYSSCLKRTSLTNDCYINWSTIGVNSLFRQITLSDRAHIYNVDLGDYSNFQNINMGAYAYIDSISTNDSTNVQNITLAANSDIYNVSLGANSYFENINIGASSYIENITNDNGTYFEHITLAPNSNIYQITLGTNSIFRNLSFLPDSSCGYVDIYSNSSISDIQVGTDSSFGEITLQSGYTISDIEIGENSGFGGINLNYNLSNRTLGRAFNNIYTGHGITGSIGNYNNTNYTSTAWLNNNQSIYLLDTTGWDGSGDPLNYYLQDGWFEGQKVELVLKEGGANMDGNVNKIRIWLAHLRDPAQGGNTDINVPWYAFANPSNGAYFRLDNPKAMWIDGAWTIDNNSWD